MTSLLNAAGKQLFEKHLHQYEPADPLYETYTDARGRTKRRKRELPPGLSQRDAKILKSVNRRAHYLDKGFKVCGMRFGWTFVIGIIPGAGDIADASLNYLLVVRKARQAELPSWLVRRMLMNNAVSAAVGLVPFAGDVILAAFKANSRNAELLQEFLRIRGEEFLKLQAQRKDGAAASGGPQTAAIKADAEATKPGAGRGAGEIVPGEAPPQKANSRGKSFGVWRGSGKKKEKERKPAAATLQPGRGKFVEDVPSGGSGQSGDEGAAGSDAANKTKK